MKKIPIYITLLLITFTAYSQNKNILNFDNCIELAIAENLQIKISDNNRKMITIDHKQSKLNLAPSFSGSANSNLNFRRSTNQNNEIESGTSYQIYYGINGSLTLFNGLTKINNINAQKYLELAYGQYTQQQIITIYLQITNLYAQILFQKELIKVAEERVKVSLQQLKRVSAFIESGLMELVSLHEIKATISGNQLELTKLVNQHELLLLELAYLIEYPEPEKLDISNDEFSDIIPTTQNLTSNDIYEKAYLNLPQLRAKEYKLAYMKKILSISKGNMFPSVNLNGGYGSNFFSSDTLLNGNQTPFSNQFNNYLNPSIELSINIPLFNGLSRNYNFKKRKLDVENALYELETEKKFLHQELEALLKKLQGLELEYKSSKDHLSFVEKSFETYSERFELGLINTTDFIIAQNQLSEAKANFISAKYKWIVQEKTIKIYTGEIVIN